MEPLPELVGADVQVYQLFLSGGVPAISSEESALVASLPEDGSMAGDGRSERDRAGGEETPVEAEPTAAGDADPDSGSSDEGEWVPTGKRDLKCEASSHHHLMTHKPKFPWCDVCRHATATRKQRRKRNPGDAGHCKFGDAVTADYIDMKSDVKRGIDGERQALIVKDLGSEFKMIYPTATRTTEDTESKP